MCKDKEQILMEQLWGYIVSFILEILKGCPDPNKWQRKFPDYSNSVRSQQRRHHNVQDRCNAIHAHIDTLNHPSSICQLCWAAIYGQP